MSIAKDKFLPFSVVADLSPPKIGKIDDNSCKQMRIAQDMQKAPGFPIFLGKPGVLAVLVTID